MASKKEKEVKKAQYYVCYMGWKECIGLFGRHYTDPVVTELVQIHQRHPFAILNKLTVQLSSKDVKITQEIEKGRGKTIKSKLPGIPAKDITFAAQGAAPDTDTVAAIFLGYNPQTKSAVHVHVYRCDSPDTAAIMARHFNQITQIAEHRTRLGKIHEDLVASGHIEPQIPIEGQAAGVEGVKKPQLFTSLADELKRKLTSPNEAPILLPPIDYDTLSRAQGKLHLRHHRKSLQHDSIAPGGVFIRKFEEPQNEDNRHSPTHSSSTGSDTHEVYEIRTRAMTDDGYSSSDRIFNHKLDRQYSFQSDRTSDRPSDAYDSPSGRRRGVESSEPLRHTLQEADFRRLRRLELN